MSTATATKSKRPTLSPEERDAKIAALKDTLDTAVLRLMNDPSQWVEFLDTISNFGARYSWGNQLLILTQAQKRGFEPTMVEPVGDLFRVRQGRKPTYGWAKLGRYPRKGEKGLQIWRPAKRRWTEEEAAEAKSQGRSVKRDEKGQLPYKIVGWRIEYVFDISQTEGDDVELPPTLVVRRKVRAAGGQRPALLTGEDTTGSLALVIKLIEAEGYSYDRVSPASLGTANGKTSPLLKKVLVRDDVDDAQALKTTIHELAHIRAGHVAEDFDYVAHRGRAETEAESTAYIVAGALGLDAEQYSAPYVASWADGKPEVVSQAAGTIIKVSKSILDDLLAKQEVAA